MYAMMDADVTVLAGPKGRHLSTIGYSQVRRQHFPLIMEPCTRSRECYFAIRIKEDQDRNPNRSVNKMISKFEHVLTGTPYGAQISRNIQVWTHKEPISPVPHMQRLEK